ncbi:MAG: DNA polymerase III subunit delta [Candidatus Dormibacteraeota bacterium]|nr:DNA polymerase III subunit delta [Candidatus Dormibacteraeota bacterium]MBV9525007.1 DNA polymerase III subunit delta [Candidatus Dormibacteraeota bacterium]
MPRTDSAPLLLIHGEERFLVDRAAAAWRARTRSAQLDVEVFDAPARLLDLRRSVAEVPLLDPERSILVRDPPQLAGGARRGADPPEDLAALLAERAPTTSVCLVAHVRVAPQNPVPAAVRELGGAIEYFAALRPREVRAWLDAEVAARGLRLGPGSDRHLLHAAGSDLGALSSELDKLAALAGGRALTAGEVAAAVAGDEPAEMYGVVDQLLGATPAAGAATLERLLAEGRSSQHLLSILAGQVRDLMLAQSHIHLKGSPAGLAATLRIPEWRAERLARQAPRVTPAVAAGWLHALHEADRRIKAGEIGDADALRLIGLRAAGEVTASR